MKNWKKKNQIYKVQLSWIERNSIQLASDGFIEMYEWT